MERRYLTGVYLTAGAATLAVLVWLTVVSPPPSDVLLPAVLFGGLILFADLFGVPLSAGVVSLLPTSTVAAYLVMGAVTTGWIAFAAALAHILLQVCWAGRLQLPRLTAPSAIAATGGANAAAHTASVLIGGAVFQALGGEVPLASVGSGSRCLCTHVSPDQSRRLPPSYHGTRARTVKGVCQFAPQFALLRR